VQSGGASPGSKRGLITEGDGNAFLPIGFNDCVGNSWNIDGSGGHSVDEYFDTYNAAGDNMFRMGFANCAINLLGNSPTDWSGLNYDGQGHNAYNDASIAVMQQIADKLHSLNWKLMLTFDGLSEDMNQVGLCRENFIDPTAFDPQSSACPYSGTPAFLQATLAYYKEIIDRWGGYVDVWEILNERWPNEPAILAYANPYWLNYMNTVIDFIRSYDPYQHPITTSFEGYPSDDQPPFDIDVSLHGYWKSANEDLDLSWSNANANTAAGFLSGFPADRPLIAGEAGQMEPMCNIDSTHERYRIGLWVNFFHHIGVLWWNSSGGLYCVGTSNMYIGPEERQQSSIFADYVSNFEPGAAPFRANLSESGKSRGYCLGGSQDIGCWIGHGADHHTVLYGDQISLDITPSLDGATAYWIDPSSLDPNTGKGALIGPPVTVNSGSTTLDIPPFASDIVLRITNSSDFGPLPTPELNLPSSLAVTRTLTAQHTAKYTGIQFQWPLTPSSTPPATASRGTSASFNPLNQPTSSAQFQTATNSGSSASYALSPDTSITWDPTNDSGGKVASGPCVYLITSGDGQKFNGQVAVVR
jgi:hypothetical protein